MTEPFVGEIQVFGFNFAPRGWASCNGATMAIQQNTALFALLGTNYGGNGTTTYQLPNFTNRAGCNQGQGPGLSSRSIGETFGSNSDTLMLNEMPAHMHQFTIYNQSDTTKKSGIPNAGNSLGLPSNTTPFLANAQPNTQFLPTMLGVTGGSQPHENRQPYLALNYSIALAGVFPSFG